MTQGPRRWSEGLELALRCASRWHRDQNRKATDIPYVSHPVAVGWMLDRHGFSESVQIAALLHDVVEDCGVPLDEIRVLFGPEVASWVEACTERKLDAAGRKRPWPERKEEHLNRLRAAPGEARAIVLADKWHNLMSMALDLASGAEVWERFNASRLEVLELAARTLELLPQGDPRLESLAAEARYWLERLESE
jgi:(p)ppGpp synthase/HD superfamily hydrolase